MKVLLPLLVICCLTSCVTQKKCLEKFPPDTIRVETISYRDTIIPFYVSDIDTVYQYGTIRDTVRVTSGTAHGMSYVIRDTLKLFVWQTDTTYQVKLDSAIKVINSQQTEIHTIREKFVPKVVRDLAGIGGVVVGAFLLWFVLKIVKFFR